MSADSFELAKRVLVNENKNLRSRLAEAERERDKWVETAKNLSQTGFSLRRFVEVYGPKLGKINTTTVIRDESKRANAAEAELATVKAELAAIKLNFEAELNEMSQRFRAANVERAAALAVELSRAVLPAKTEGE